MHILIFLPVVFLYINNTLLFMFFFTSIIFYYLCFSLHQLLLFILIILFSYFLMKICCGTHQKHLTEVLLMSTHNICFPGEIRKIFT